MLVKKTFPVKEVKIITVDKEFQVLENARLYRVTKDYMNFKIGEIILVHKSFYIDNLNTVAHNVTWWFKDGQYKKGLQVVDRDVQIQSENFERVPFATLQKYIIEQ